MSSAPLDQADHYRFTEQAARDSEVRVLLDGGILRPGKFTRKANRGVKVRKICLIARRFATTEIAAFVHNVVAVLAQDDAIPQVIRSTLFDVTDMMSLSDFPVRVVMLARFSEL